MRDPQAATERVGRYQLLEPIGTGPNGAVSRAKVFGVAGFERQFAVKRFSSELTTTPALAQALSAAARQYGSLEHPRIARMAEFGVAQGQTFTAVEYVAGLDAMRLMAEAKLANVTLATGGGLALISQAARAVGYAHGRGLSHLGLAPTNLIVTSEGDVKVTDFGILASTMPARPTDVARYANRIPYLAPEQLNGEAISAATDVFVLGVMAYELVTSQRAFKGDNAQQVARSILAGPPPDPPLPRPIVRVLQRCLARSPFERFPDARALADALDAALRVAPVPGTRKDIGAQVKATLDRLAALNEGQLSGVLALNIGTGPIRPATPAQHVATLGRESQESLPTSEYQRPDMNVPLPPLPRFESPAITRPDLPKPIMSTMPGLAPPPIPVPPGVTAPPNVPPPPSGAPNTMMGMAAAKKPMVPPSIPPIRPRTEPQAQPQPPPIPTFTPVEMPDPHEEPTRIGAEIPKLAHAMRQRTNNDDDLIVSIENEDPHASATLTGDQRAERDATVSERDATLSEHDPSGTERNTTVAERNITDRASPGRDESAIPERIATQPGHTPPPRLSPIPREVQVTDEMSPTMSNAYTDASIRPTAEVEPLLAQVWSQDPHAGFPDEQHVEESQVDESHVPASFDPHPTPPPMPLPMPSTPPPIPTRSSQPPPHVATQSVRAQSGPRAKWPFIVIPIIVIGAAAGGAWQIWGNKTEKIDDKSATGSGSAVKSGSSAIVIAATPDAAVQIAMASDAQIKVAAAADASAQVAAMIDAQIKVAATPDAAAVVAQTVDAGTVQATPSDSLQIASSPGGARVFIDGADQGVTPVKLPGSADRHTVALLLAGHELYVAEVDGHGAFNIALKPVTPVGGPAGIKVIKCKDKDRYYVTVDGKPTGMTCPTERIECSVGPHTVEVYDIVTESRKKFDINVADTRLSYRVRIE